MSDDYPCWACGNEDACYGVEAQYCCDYCRYLGFRDCDSCDKKEWILKQMKEHKNG